MNEDHIKFYMQRAIEEAQKSTCIKRKVGCVIVHAYYNQITEPIAYGYNKPCSSDIRCPDDCLSDHGKCISTNHAEMVALHNVESPYELRDFNDDCYVFVTTSPCLSCFKELVYAGVGGIYYLEPFGDIELVERLKPIYAPKLILERVVL